MPETEKATVEDTEPGEILIHTHTGEPLMVEAAPEMLSETPTSLSSLCVVPETQFDPGCPVGEPEPASSDNMTLGEAFTKSRSAQKRAEKRERKEERIGKRNSLIRSSQEQGQFKGQT